jgi:hypothetical protein
LLQSSELLAKRERNQVWLHVKDRELEERRRPTLHLRNPTILQLRLRPGSRIQLLVLLVLLAKPILELPYSTSILAWRWDLRRSIPMTFGKFLTILVKPSYGLQEPLEQDSAEGSVFVSEIFEPSLLCRH